MSVVALDPLWQDGKRRAMWQRTACSPEQYGTRSVECEVPGEHSSRCHQPDVSPFQSFLEPGGVSKSLDQKRSHSEEQYFLPGVVAVSSCGWVWVWLDILSADHFSVQLKSCPK